MSATDSVRIVPTAEHAGQVLAMYPLGIDEGDARRRMSRTGAPKSGLALMAKMTRSRRCVSVPVSFAG